MVDLINSINAKCVEHVFAHKATRNTKILGFGLYGPGGIVSIYKRIVNNLQNRSTTRIELIYIVNLSPKKYDLGKAGP
jgi:hypothetical protein